MPAFRQRNPSTGQVYFDTGAGDRAAVILGSFTINYNVNPSGTIQVPAIEGSRPFFFLRGQAFDGAPNFSVSGPNVSWSRPAGTVNGTWEVLYGGIDLVTLGPVSGGRLTLRNPDTGKIVFTSRFANYQHTDYATVADTGVSYQRAVQWRITMASIPPSAMLAMRPTTALTAPMAGYFNGSGQYAGVLVATASRSQSPGNGQYFVVGKPTVLAARPGLNCRNPDTNELTFSSAQQAMRVVEVYNADEVTFTGTPGRQYAAIFSGPIALIVDEETDVIQDRGQIVIGPDPPYYDKTTYALGVRVDASSPHVLTFGWLRTSGAGYGVKKNNPDPTQRNTGQLMIIDVTGLF